jgi:phage/plasmid-associated DNA primase
MSGHSNGPSSREISAIKWSAVEEKARNAGNPAMVGFNNFVNNIACNFVTGKGDDATNIIDQGDSKTYAMNNDTVQELFNHLEACRKGGLAMHFSEKQGSPTVPHTGLMLDYDIITTDRNPVITEQHYYGIVNSIVAVLKRDVNFMEAATSAPPNHPMVIMGTKPGTLTTPENIRFHIFFITKREAVPTAVEGQFKYGFHILIPGIKLGRAYKKWFMREFKSDQSVCAILSHLGCVESPEECLDQNSASVPVLFLGSCKRGGIPYNLALSLEVTVGLASWVSSPVIKLLTPEYLAGYNLVAELSLVFEAVYPDGRAPLAPMMNFNIRPDLITTVQSWVERSADGMITQDELLFTDNSLSTMLISDPEASRIHIMLDLLTPEYYTERGKWRDVIFAIASGSHGYKSLAVWFSQKCPQKWLEGGQNALDSIWNDATAGHRSDNPITVRSLSFWARTCNPEQYAVLMEKSYYTMFNDNVYKHHGKLGHFMIAEVLYAMLGSKFCVDVENGGKAYVWYEFVLPGDNMLPGQAWKWRKEEVSPDTMYIYISTKLTRVAEQISAHIEEQKAKATDENRAKYYNSLARSFATTKSSLYNNTFKNCVIKEANHLFRRRGFADALDTLPYLFGTANGVLKLGKKCELIDYFHEYPISHYTPVVYTPFDPHNPSPWQKLVLDSIENIIVEPDARDWVLFHASQGLSGDPKEGLFLLWGGGGQNGKTALLRGIAKALGPYANKFNIQLMSSEREDADRPNSAMMAFKTLRYGYSEESNKAQVLNVARMKEMVNPGEISGRELNKRQETFTMKANLVAASQYPFIVNTTDHGTWRRLRHYTSKAKFRADPDPNNPFEKKEDQRFVRQYPSDPNFQSAMLSILVYYYERLQTEYNGELKNVHSPTIDAETEGFRVEQDSMHRWIGETLVISPDEPTEYLLGDLSTRYTAWFQKNISRKDMSATEVIKELESSALGKYIRPSRNGAPVVKGCRLLSSDTFEDVLRPGEQFLAEIAYRAGKPTVCATPPTPGTTKWWLPAHNTGARCDTTHIATQCVAMRGDPQPNSGILMDDIRVSRADPQLTVAHIEETFDFQIEDIVDIVDNVDIIDNVDTGITDEDYQLILQ